VARRLCGRLYDGELRRGLGGLLEEPQLVRRARCRRSSRWATARQTFGFQKSNSSLAIDCDLDSGMDPLAFAAAKGAMLADALQVSTG